MVLLWLCEVLFDTPTGTGLAFVSLFLIARLNKSLGFPVGLWIGSSPQVVMPFACIKFPNLVRQIAAHCPTPQPEVLHAGRTVPSTLPPSLAGFTVIDSTLYARPPYLGACNSLHMHHSGMTVVEFLENLSPTGTTTRIPRSKHPVSMLSSD